MIHEVVAAVGWIAPDIAGVTFHAIPRVTLDATIREVDPEYGGRTSHGRADVFGRGEILDVDLPLTPGGSPYSKSKYRVSI